jgi:hypothetical protein
MGRLADLQNAPIKPTIHRVRYTEPEWELLAQAMFAELAAGHVHLGLSIVQLANQAQKNQPKVLLGDSYDPSGQVAWDARNFTAVVQLMPAMRYMHKIMMSHKEAADLFKVSSDESKAQAKRIQELEAEVAVMKARPPSFEHFAPEDIVAEAAFIQAQQAERLEKAAAGLKAEMAKVGELVSDSKRQVSSEVKSFLDAAVATLSDAMRDNRPKPVVPTVLTVATARSKNNGSHHKKALQRR